MEKTTQYMRRNDV